MHQAEVTATAVSTYKDLSFARHKNMGSEFYNVLHSWLQPYLCIPVNYWKLEHTAINYDSSSDFSLATQTVFRLDYTGTLGYHAAEL